MKHAGLIFVAFLILASTHVAQGQTQDKSRYLVSAKAGVVNFIKGDLYYTAGGRQNLLSGEELRTGETATTGSESRAEILLSPGSYLRLDQDTQFALSDPSLNDLTVTLLKGSAIVEASRSDDRSSMVVTMATPKAAFSVFSGGLYRFNVDASGRTEALVYKGKLVANGSEIKEGERVVVDGGLPAIASFDKKTEDYLDLWSKERAKELVVANEKIKSDYIKEAHQNSYALSYGGYGYGPAYGWYSSWFYNPFLGCYTFLPGAHGFYSPYGWRYRVFYPIPVCWVIRRPGTILPNPGGSSGRNSANPSRPSSPEGNPRPGHRVGINPPRNHPVRGTPSTRAGGGRHHR